MTVPTQSGREKPQVVDIATAMGVISVIVPTDVPIAVETKQLTTKSTKTANCGGTIESRKYATLSAQPRPTTPTNIPARRNISSMVIMFLSHIPCPINDSLFSKLTSLFCRQATSNETKKITTMGTL